MRRLGSSKRAGGRPPSWAALFLGLAAGLAQAEETPEGLEELTVTGSFIQREAGDESVAVTLIDREMLEAQGAPSMIELVKNLSASYGVIGENRSNYGLGRNIAESVGSVNLRGLGASRTLVLLNNRRQVYVPARLTGGRFVDVNAFPLIAMDRIEILKEGAAAVYGSDALGGVVNFMTRKDFEGTNLATSYDYYDDGGDATLSAIWGAPVGTHAHAMVAVEHYRREEMTARDRDWALRGYVPGAGAWSGTGNPGSFVVYDQNGRKSYTNSAGNTIRASVDPECENFGGVASFGATCRYRYTYTNALVDEQHHTRLFGELNGSIAKAWDYHLEAMYAKAVVPRYATSPSYPPAAAYNSNRLQDLPSNHPALPKIIADLDPLLYQAGDSVGFHGRMLGNGSSAVRTRKDQETWRLAGSVDGTAEWFEARELDYDLGLTYAHSEGRVTSPGGINYRRYLAFNGFGGPNCGVSAIPDTTKFKDAGSQHHGLTLYIPNNKQPGVGDCHWYNPHNSALEYSMQPGSPYSVAPNPNYDPALANDPAMIAWMHGVKEVESKANLYVFDATVSGEVGEGLGHFAAGYQFRRFQAEGSPSHVGDLDANPCIINPAQVPEAVRQAANLTAADFECPEHKRTGLFAYTSSDKPYKEHQTTHSVFGEWAVPLGHAVDAQLAIHYEEHEESNTLDPKVALRWEAADGLTLRGVAQTTFRAPSVDDLNESPVGQQRYIAAIGTFRPVEVTGSKDLDPEEALTYNLGMAMQFDNGVRWTMDYWHYDFDDSIIALPFRDVMAAFENESTRALVADFVYLPEGRGSDLACQPAGSVDCSITRIERIRTPLINGPTIKTSGIDFELGGRHDTSGGVFSWGLNGTYLLKYDLDALVYKGVKMRDKVKAAGFYNDPADYNVQPLPRLKANGFAGYRWANGYHVTAFMNFISSYDDRRRADQYREIDSFVTLDLSFGRKFAGDRAELAAVVYNIGDEQPPETAFDSSYDNLTHDPKGRRLKVVFRYRFDS